MVLSTIFGVIVAAATRWKFLFPVFKNFAICCHKNDTQQNDFRILFHDVDFLRNIVALKIVSRNITLKQQTTKFSFT